MDHPSEKNPEISIIIPVYKVERYLRQCLDSVLAQTFTDWECIVVDDGSPDNCPAICDEYGARDPRFKVIHRENGGQGAARNSGLRIARGKYIGFIDPDDWADECLFETLHNLIEETDTDMAQVGFFKEYKGYANRKTFVDRITVLNHKEIVRELVFDRKIPSFLWQKLFRKEVINSEFPEGKVFEDITVLSSWGKNIRTAVLSPQTLYHYRCRKGSTLHSNYISGRLQCFQANYDRFSKLFLLRHDFFSESERAKYLWRIAVNAAKTIAREGNDREYQMKAVKEISETTKNFPAPSLSHLSPKRYLRASLLLNHPRLFVYLVRFEYLFNIDAKFRKSHLQD